MLVLSLVVADVHPLCLEVRPCQLYLRHQLFVCLWYVSECKHSPAELEKEICAEGNECPERNLL